MTETKTIPRPTGYNIIVRMPQLKKRTAGNIILPDVAHGQEELAAMTGKIVAVGPDAFRDLKRFPSGSDGYAKVGDWVLFTSYTGTRLSVGDVKYRVIHDTSVEAIVDGPNSIDRDRTEGINLEYEDD